MFIVKNTAKRKKIREHYEQFYGNNFENLGTMYKFLKKYNSLKQSKKRNRRPKMSTTI